MFGSNSNTDKTSDSNSENQNNSNTNTIFAPLPIVNSFRGRINTTYISNPNWYNSK